MEMERGGLVFSKFPWESVGGDNVAAGGDVGRRQGLLHSWVFAPPIRSALSVFKCWCKGASSSGEVQETENRGKRGLSG